MKTSCIVLLTVLAVSLVLVAGEKCKTHVNCRLPKCRCWNDPNKPGNINESWTPQIVMLTFSYALNEHTVKQYLPLFEGISNPNGCPAKGTFFSQNLDTTVDSLKQLYQQGHEIGLTSCDGKIPTNKREWVESLFKSSEKLYDAGIPRNKMKGVRAPEQFIGGNNELQALMQFGMDYDASCVIDSATNNAKPLWPYTYNFIDNNPHCHLGSTPNNTFSGMWQFMMSEVNFRNHHCASLSDCSPMINSSLDAFTLFFNLFQNHYFNGRTPLVLNIDPLWMTKKVQVEGLKQFLGVIGAHNEVWMVTMTQALDWIQFPVPMYKDVKFWPWECSQEEKFQTMKKLRPIVNRI